MGVQRRRRGRLAGSRIRPRRQWTAHHRNVPHQVHQFLKNPSLSNLVLKNEGLRMVPTSLRQRHLSTHKIGRPCMMVMNWRCSGEKRLPCWIYHIAMQFPADVQGGKGRGLSIYRKANTKLYGQNIVEVSSRHVE